MSNISSHNMSNETEALDLSKSFQYNVIVPVFILASLATFVINFVIILSYPLIRNLSRVSNIQILLKYIPKIHGILCDVAGDSPICYLYFVVVDLRCICLSSFGNSTSIRFIFARGA